MALTRVAPPKAAALMGAVVDVAIVEVVGVAICTDPIRVPLAITEAPTA